MTIDNPWNLDPTAPASNTSFNSVNVAEGMAPSLVNNAMRQLGSFVAQATSYKSADISASVSTNIAATGSGLYRDIVGTGTINSFGSPAGAEQPNAAVLRILQFDSSVSVSHSNGAIALAGSGSRKFEAGAVLGVIHEGSGGWRELFNNQGVLTTAANTYTAAQAITITAAGSALTATSTDAGATAGPLVTLHRNSATPAANDFIGGVYFEGRDSGAASQLYSYVDGVILDPTAGSEDGQIRLNAFIAGSATNILAAGPGVTVGGATDKGVGTINAAAGLYVNGHGTIAQVVSDTEATYTTCGTIMPDDDTIPQNTEGDEVLSAAITPTNASSTLEIVATLNVGAAGTGTEVVAAIFVDTTADAINAGGTFIQNSASMQTLVLRHLVSAGSTSARTYKVRVGSGSASDAFLNGHGTSRQFGGVCISSLVVREILPQ